VEVAGLALILYGGARLGADAARQTDEASAEQTDAVL